MNRVSRSGFTIVELMLAMGFVSALLLAIAMTVIQISNIYTRGMTFTNVNQEGRVIADELQRSISSSNKFSAVPNGTNYIKYPESGRLCIGSYSYVWNYGKYINNPATNYIKYKAPDANTKIYFVKVYDPNLSVCTLVGASYPSIDKANAVELVNSGQFDLAVHSFSLKSYPATASDGSTGQQLYNIGLDLGTNDQNAFNAGTTVCSVSGPNSNPNYCSVSHFDILARAGSATN